MPTRRRAPVRRKRRTKFRRQRKIGRSLVVNRSPMPVAPRFITRLKYASQFSSTGLTIVAGVLSDYHFRINSLYDPDSSATGHQPYGFDQLIALYGNYRVFATSWIVTVPSSSQPLTVVVLPENGGTTFSNLEYMSEQPRAITRTTPYNGGTATMIKGKMYLPRLMGVSSAEYRTDDRFAGDASSNPAEIGLLHLGIYSPANCSVYPSIQIIYHCEFTDPNVVTQS